METPNTPEQRDPKLWSLARKRVAFKRALGMYLVVNIFLWVIWFLTDDEKAHGIPWAVWPTVGWGVAILFQYLNAYKYPGENAAENEYEKLKRKA
jgi:hypothetical protein